MSGTQIPNAAQRTAIRLWRRLGCARTAGAKKFTAQSSRTPIIRAFRESLLEKTLYAVDELSSFVIAVALVRPTKSIHAVDVRAVRKKMKDKAFARAVNREDIARGAEQLGAGLDEVIAEVVAALRSDAARLGLDGSAQAQVGSEFFRNDFQHQGREH